MIAYITLGADDMDRAKRFYTAFLPALGYTLEESAEGVSFALPTTASQPSPQPEIYVKPAFNGQPASAGNGSMVAFDARFQQNVRDLHAAALAAGGVDAGTPGFRAAYSAHFYVGYLRDPYGNKIALFSNNPEEPGRSE
ncbi:VOC family protein [Aliiroseovarius crassostreae]|uniref:VOC family protein n=1 Tax=Aliiroseovarius crassostreae TaxID=154981 RepID=UPI00220989FF|nr:VOC family protein [Aliiroseovarius crassostreae]UWP88155.1 VOC family protein [Aliiroseovarius crassostreae]UWQ00773.1 VOC family protein [Aliiroseovarius crassostreae]